MILLFFAYSGWFSFALKVFDLYQVLNFYEMNKIIL